MASGAYPPALDCVTGAVDYDTDTFYVMLLTSAYTENFDTHTRRSDLTNEVANSGTYSAGGASVTVTVSAFNTGTNKRVITFGAITFTGTTITARKAAYYKRRGGLATADELIGLNDFGTDKTSASGDFTINASTFEIELNAA